MVQESPSSSGTPALSVAYDFSRARMCQCSTEGRVSVWSQLQGEDMDGEELQWVLDASWTLPSGKAVQAAWAHPAFGGLLAVASAEGSVSLWGEIVAEEGTIWQQQCALAGCREPVAALCFAPHEQGPLLAVGSVSGTVRLYAGSSALAAEEWLLDNEIVADREGACTSLGWAPHSPGLPPLLLVGTSTGAKVFCYTVAHMRWRVSCELGAGGGPVSAVAWPQGVGSTVAVVSGKQVTLHRLSGDASHLQAEVEGKLELPSPASHLEWNSFGTWLAVSLSREPRIMLWRKNLVGEWTCPAAAVGAAL